MEESTGVTGTTRPTGMSSAEAAMSASAPSRTSSAPALSRTSSAGPSSLQGGGLVRTPSVSMTSFPPLPEGTPRGS
jgi:hypothetical protein